MTFVRVTCAAAAALVFACGGAGGTQTPSPSSARGGNTITIDENANGSTLTVASGTQIVVILHSTYWSFDSSSAPSVLRQPGAPTVSPAPIGTCVPGGGCGTVTAAFIAAGIGSAVITASRTSCG